MCIWYIYFIICFSKAISSSDEWIVISCTTDRPQNMCINVFICNEREINQKSDQISMCQHFFVHILNQIYYFSSVWYPIALIKEICLILDVFLVEYSREFLRELDRCSTTELLLQVLIFSLHDPWAVEPSYFSLINMYHEYNFFFKHISSILE